MGAHPLLGGEKPWERGCSWDSFIQVSDYGSDAEMTEEMVLEKLDQL